MKLRRGSLSPSSVGKALLLPVLTGLLLTGCTSPGNPSSAPTIAETPQAVSHGSGALVHARHGECNFGPKVMKYLATGDNQGDPRLDKMFAGHVGAPGPEARQIVDDAIEKCDGAADQREAVQASASASAEAATAKASAEAQASASADAARASLLAKERPACAAIGGRLNPSSNSAYLDTCDAPNPDAAATNGTLCAYAQIAFNTSGQMAQSDIDVVKDGYPGCFK
ncbi:hypothetical protein [Arthrobacter woluwensis]|uniref:hypothetical protein n=1 Tax=Arthrobacter woluwensis TaxID=156980 RepID=UPI0011A85E48|nr:hypothetical protein [Arthrobacter woluwensis]